jgi:transketolase
MNNFDIQNLEEKAKELRRKVLDLGIEKGEVHIGGCFSEIEILITIYNIILEKEDKFILSKGHCCHPMYLLLMEKGYHPQINSHPDIDEQNGIFCTTGSLGHGLPIGAGMALARKIQGKTGNIYVLMGDGECQEGSIWETLPLATKHNLDNLVIIIDKNKLQAFDSVNNISPMDLKKMFESFGCYVIEVNGHSFLELIMAMHKKVPGKPKVIIAETIKGKGICFMENKICWQDRKSVV